MPGAHHQWLSSIIAGFVFVILILVDQVSKYWANSNELITINRGIAFGLLDNLPFSVLIVLLIVVLAVGLWAWHQYVPDANWAGVLFFGGAVSNVLDRVMIGGVRDWLPTPILATKNNLADWYITAGVVVLCWQLVQRQTQNRGKQE